MSVNATEPTERSRWREHLGPLAALALAGLVLGASGLDPRLWPLAWLGVAGTAWGLAREGNPRWAAGGLLLSTLLTHACWFSWGPLMVRALRPEDRSMDTPVVLGLAGLTGLPIALALMLGAWLSRGRVPLRLWLPAARVLGERLEVHWTSVPAQWLRTQVDQAPAMRALSRLGLAATTFGCLFIAVSLGEAVARRRPRLLLLPALLLLGAARLPPLEPHLERVEHIAAVHLRSVDELPALDGAGATADLVVWPETAFSGRPAVAEGLPRPARLDAPLGGAATWHLVGMETLLTEARQNSALAVDPEGAVVGMRAKRILFPVYERRLLGVGQDLFAPGRAPPRLDCGEHRLVPLICGEMLTSGLVAEGRAAGGEVLAVLASDRYQAHSALTQWQVLSELRLRAVEFQLPAVYASLEGRAAIVAADGQVLARSEDGAPSGLLTWTRAGGARDERPPAAPTVAVLYSERAPHLRPDCPPGRCTYYALERLPEQVPPARTVIVAGHSAPPVYLGRSAAEVAAAVARFHPELVVADTCFGASSPLLAALAPLGAEVVAAPSFVAGRGFRYGRAFFAGASLQERADAVETVPPTPLYRARPSAEEMGRLEHAVEALSGDELRPRVRSWVPTLVTMEASAGAPVLVPADWKKIGHPPAVAR